MKYRYEEFTWPEIKEAVAGNRVAVLPVGTVEQHGPHLPLVTDVLTAGELSRRAVESMPDAAVLLPPVYYSFNEHHLDFPGTIAIPGDTIIDYVTHIGVNTIPGPFGARSGEDEKEDERETMVVSPSKSKTGSALAPKSPSVNMAGDVSFRK